MALRDKLAERVRPHLEPGEQLRQVFQAQTGPSPYWIFLTYLTMLWNKYVIVAVTDRAIVTFRATAFKPTFVKQPAEVHRLDRRRALGPLKGLWGKVDLDGQKFWIHRRFHSDVAQADAELQYFGGAAAAASSGSPGAVQPVAGSADASSATAVPPIPSAATAAPTAAMAPAGWYPDPKGVAAQRYWDGATWTDHTGVSPVPGPRFGHGGWSPCDQARDRPPPHLHAGDDDPGRPPAGAPRRRAGRRLRRLPAFGILGQILDQDTRIMHLNRAGLRAPPGRGNVSGVYQESRCRHLHLDARGSSSPGERRRPRDAPVPRAGAPSGIVMEVAPGESLLAAAQRQGLTWPTLCGGEASCRTCYVVVEGGAEHLAPPSDLEQRGIDDIARVVRTGEIRLACQAVPRRHARDSGVRRTNGRLRHRKEPCNPATSWSTATSCRSWRSVRGGGRRL